MLTIHKYKNLDKDWDQDKILECCKKTPPATDPCKDCCYDSWTNEVKQVNKKYKAKVEEAAQLEKKLAFLTDRRGKFKTWLDELEAAQKMAQDICKQLELIAAHSNKIWANSFLAVKAIQVLFCMIRDFFMQLDCLKVRYDLLQDCINKSTDPLLKTGDGIVKYLTEYGTKLDAVIKTRDDIIKAAVLAIQLSNLLRNDISTRGWHNEYVPSDKQYNPCSKDQPPCPDPHSQHPHYGFKTIICEWHRFFNCDECCNDNTAEQIPNNNQQVSPRNMPVKQGSGCCDDSCDLETFSFPICNNEYKYCIKERYEKDDNKVKKINEMLNEANKEKEALQACKNSLDAAIKEVNPADRCK